MTPDYDYTDYAVFLTGAGQSIGYALAEAFVVAGASVGLNDIDPDRATAAAQRLDDHAGRPCATAYPFDVADVEALRQAIDAFAAQQGRLDVAVAHAGLTDYAPVLEATPAAFDRLMAVNLRGTYFTAQAAARQMVARQTPHGRLLVLSSVTGTQALRGLSAYGLTKAAQRHLVRTMGVELAPHRITVNAVAPGATVCARNLQDDPDYAAHWAAVTPNAQCATPDDIVAALLFLASPAARHVTGQTLVVDGGWTATSPLPVGFPT